MNMMKILLQVIPFLILIFCHFAYADLNEQLGIGKNFMWEIDLKQTGCPLETKQNSNCNFCDHNLNESLRFISAEKVEVLTVCNNNKEIKIKDCTIIADESSIIIKDNQQFTKFGKITIDNNQYFNLTFIDKNSMKLFTTPTERNQQSLKKVYKRIENVKSD